MTAFLPSYIAKSSRAEKHLIDLEAEIERYASRKPYNVADSIEGKHQKKVRRLHMTQDVADTDIPILTADAIYNMRSSLDHLMSALVTKNDRNSAIFPLYFQGVWDAIVPGEKPQRVKSRISWASHIKTLPDEAIAFLKTLQPPDDAGDEVQLHRLAVIGRLSNRDRHEKLPVIASGLHTVAIGWEMPDGTSRYGIGRPKPGGFFEDDAMLSKVPEDAMNVKIEGTPTIVIRTHEGGTGIKIPEELWGCLRMIRECVIPKLSPYVRPDV
jgi:hypothetical protein